MKSKLRIRGSKTPLTEERLSMVERRLGVKLPQSYRRFLLKHNGGHPTPSGFRYKHERGPYTDSEVASFFAVYRGKTSNLEEEFRFFKVTHEWLPKHLVPIGDDPFGSSICISVAGKDSGTVYFRNVEGFPGEPGTDVTEWSNIHLLADSFDEFLSNLSDD